MSIQRRATAFALVLMMGAATLPADAAAESAPVSVKVNMARILRISAPANTVIIGNPRVADVTIQDPQTLVLTGKSYGQTNMIVLDAQGNPIADTLIEVVQSQTDLVTVYLGSARTTLACAPVCQPTIMLGDDPAFSAASSASAQVTAGN
jgi:Flp pilus assembly secretin CpaC